ncbi:MAG: GNAT family N-acetyltransferase [Ancrocorticia sp.]|uniref:GNAT family N-acetyltransferase n=1 Tax=Ancrocorticia sp. TaxID=2593684 RepID=UPI003F8F540C
MAIREITAIEVAQLAPRLVDHMARIRRDSGALRPSAVESFRATQLQRFRVGTPCDSRIFVNDSLDQWLWIDTTLVDVYVEPPVEPWVDALAAIMGGKEILVHRFSHGDSFEFFDALALREIGHYLTAHVRVLGGLQEEGQEPLKRTDVFLRSMSAGELGEFTDAICESWGRHRSVVELNQTADELRKDAEATMRRTLYDGVSTPGHEVLAICTETQVVGGIWVEIDGSHAKLWKLYIYRPYRGHSYSRGALIALGERLRGEGAKRIRTELLPTQHHIREVFESAGFTLTEKVVGASA